MLSATYEVSYLVLPTTFWGYHYHYLRFKDKDTDLKVEIKKFTQGQNWWS